MELFFTDDEVENTAIDHIEKISSFSDAESERIIKSYKRVRQDLRDRLDVLNTANKDKSFTAQKTRAALLQVDLAIKTMSDKIEEDLDSSSMDAGIMGVQNLITELEKFNKRFTGAVMPINLNAVAVATETSNFLFNRRQASLQAYNAAIRSNIANQITESVIANDDLSQVISNIGKFFQGEEWRIQRLVRTELHNVYNQGKINGMKDLVAGDIPDLKKTLFHPMDRRTGKDSIRLNKNNPIVDIDEPFVESSTGKKLTYMAPPNRPNDRAILIPYREEWNK